MQLRRWLVPVGTIMVLGIPATAQASIGVGIQAGPVQLSGAAHAGGHYTLPPVYVVNTGTQQESVSIRVERVSSGPQRAVPASWVRVPGTSVHLSHNQAARIPLQLVVPATARPGQYLSDVVVRGSAGLPDGGANLGVAAATKLEFSIAPGLVSGAWFSLPGWVLIAAVVMIAIAIAAMLVRRSGVRIRIERSAAGFGQASPGTESGDNAG